MRRALVALAVVGVIAFTTTPAAACSLPSTPLSISPPAGGPGTNIQASGYCEGDLTVTLGWPVRSDALRAPVDTVSVAGNHGSFQVTLNNRYAPPLGPEQQYFFDMEVTSVCGGDQAGRLPFLATEHVTYSPAHVYTVPADGPCGYGLAPTEAEARIPCPANVRVFDPSGAAYNNYYAGTDGWGGTVAVGSPPGGGSDVVAIGAGPGTRALFSYGSGSADAYPDFRGGVNVAVGDVDGDGTDDVVTAPGAGGGPDVKVWKLLPNDPHIPPCGSSFGASAGWYAYDPHFAGGVSVAVADLDGDGKAEIITGALAGGGPHVRVWDEAGHLKSEFMAYDPNFHGGVNVAAGDLLGDGRAEIVTGAGPGGGPHVRVLNASGVAFGGFYAYAPEWTGGVFVAVGHPTPGSGKASIVTGAGPGGGPHVRVLDANGNGGGGFYAYENIPAGVHVAVAP